MELHDPATGAALADDTIQRVLFVCNTVHIYNIPPLTTMRGHNAASWTSDPSRHIFTARCRVVETSSSSDSESRSSQHTAGPKVKVDIVLEDGSTGQLFAAAPYTDRNAVEPVMDSSRFFAVTVRDPQGRKATLGIGFEERSDAFDFSVALQEAGRNLGWDGEQKTAGSEKTAPAKDYSLKEGETITVNLGSKLGRRRPQQQSESSETESASLQSFALPPPPAAPAAAVDSGGSFALTPPPSTQSVKEKRRSIRDLGFDDGQFGEFA